MEAKIANWFAMSDEVWMRHANPWSVWTRFSVLPLLVVAIWSRVWIGWFSLGPIALSLLWTWYNPRAFPKPTSTQNWASKAVFGERVWLQRDTIPVPDRHRQVPHILNLVSAVGAIVLGWGLWQLQLWPTVTGMLLVMLGKLWFVDRMVWLYEDMKDRDREYQSWLY